MFILRLNKSLSINKGLWIKSSQKPYEMLRKKDCFPHCHIFFHSSEWLFIVASQETVLYLQKGWDVFLEFNPADTRKRLCLVRGLDWHFKPRCRNKKRKVPIHTMKAYGGNRGTAVLILNLGARRERMLNITPRPLSVLKRNSGLLEQGVWWAPDPVWTTCRTEKPNAFAGIRTFGSSST